MREECFLSGQSLRLDLWRRCLLEVRSLRQESKLSPHLLQTHSSNWIDDWIWIQLDQIRLINGLIYWLSHSPTQQTFKERTSAPLSTSVDVRTLRLSGVFLNPSHTLELPVESEKCWCSGFTPEQLKKKISGSGRKAWVIKFFRWLHCAARSRKPLV